MQVPSETFKAAAHLVVTGCKRRFPKVKIILAHLGGSTPFLASRVAILARHMGCQLTSDEILRDFRTFYYDTALSAWGPSLSAMDNFVPHTQVIFGTDFPGKWVIGIRAISPPLLSALAPSNSGDCIYVVIVFSDILFLAVSTQMSLWFTQQLINHYSAEHDDGFKLHDIVRNNALEVFPALCARILAKGSTIVAKIHNIPYML